MLICLVFRWLQDVKITVATCGWWQNLFSDFFSLLFNSIFSSFTFLNMLYCLKFYLCKACLWDRRATWYVCITLTQGRMLFYLLLSYCATPEHIHFWPGAAISVITWKDKWHGFVTWAHKLLWALGHKYLNINLGH